MHTIKSTLDSVLSRDASRGSSELQATHSDRSKHDQRQLLLQAVLPHVRMLLRFLVKLATVVVVEAARWTGWNHASGFEGGPGGD